MISAVRRQAEWVAGQADFVKVRHDLLPAYAAQLLNKYPLINQMGADTHLVDPADLPKTAAYIFALDSINFGSGYFETARTAGIPLEYDAIAGGLKRAFEGGELNTPEKWQKATAMQFHAILNIRQGVHPLLDQLMGLFADHLRFTGKHVQREAGGDVMNILKTAEGSAVKLAERVAGWVGFQDKAQYKGREVPLYKRAQILASDLYLAFQGRAPANFSDMNGLTIFADNMVPHVLRYDGILEYAPSLAEKIDTGRLLDAGSMEEVEIRACAIHAVELIKQSALKTDRQVTSVNLDHILWHRGYEPDVYALPKHRTMTVWY